MTRRPGMSAFLVTLIVAIVVLSAASNRRSPLRCVSGTVAAVEAGKWIVLAATPQTAGYSIRLRETTVYEGNPATVTPGARVTVRWRSVGERMFVAEEVRQHRPERRWSIRSSVAACGGRVGV